MRAPTILVIDDDPAILDYLSHKLRDGFEVLCAASAEAGMVALGRERVDLVLLDLNLDGDPDAGLNLLPHLKETDATLEVIVITAGHLATTAFECGRRGAFDYIQKPIDEEQLVRLRHAMSKAIEKRRLTRDSLSYRKELEQERPHEILYASPGMESMMQLVREVAPTDSAVLITGETGVGKELVARAIHRNSRRKDRPFVAVHLGAVPDNLLESELFGHEKGAFTGATERRLGKFELADTGTFFFDEIGTMPPSVQVRLLRVLQEQEIERLGGQKTIPVDVRIISATNLDLDKAIEQGQFRRDLYYRIHTVPINVPPLRERPQDIEVLAAAFLSRYARRYRRGFQAITPAAMRLLRSYAWAGNVRELQHLIERVVSTHDAENLEVRHLPFELTIEKPADGEEAASLRGALADTERRLILQALSDHSHNQSRAAEALGIDRTTLIYKMKKLGIRPLQP
ncbi:MAG: sigma-54-dependent Fis family transcriptional regulator [Nitrospirae bacterium]|nr:sigma-54-dependent Fis family transcriptional regulator [Nitrospirota bacterium]